MIALLRMSAGLIVWAVAFCVLYGLHGIGCAGGWRSAPPAPLVAAWLAAIAAGVATAWWLRRPGPELVDRTAWWLALVGIAATVVTGLPIVALPACL